MNIEFRTLVEVNTDPQRRCYNGCHLESELQWTEWDWIEWGLPPDKVEERLKFWKELNDYSVSVGGRKKEFRVVETPEE